MVDSRRGTRRPCVDGQVDQIDLYRNASRLKASHFPLGHSADVPIDATVVCYNCAMTTISSAYFIRAVHEIWALSQGTQVREVESGFRYTPTTLFRDLSLPRADRGPRSAISAAAKELDELRIALAEPAGVDEDGGLGVSRLGRRAVGAVRRSGNVCSRPHPQHLSRSGGDIGTVRWPRIVPKDADCAASLKKRTLTNLYNQRPAWLDLAHKKLDAAVFAAYGWDPGMSDEELLERLLRLNLERAEYARTNE